MLLWCLWVVLLFDPQWWFAAHGLTPFLKAPLALFALFVVTLLVGVPGIADWRRHWTWYAPFLLFVATGVVTLPFTLNSGYAREALQQYLLYWTLIVGTVTLVTTARRAELLLFMYGLQFVWWGIWGARSGLIPWHHSFGNYDGFGAFAVGGVGMCYFLALAAPMAWFRRIMYATAALCAMAVVATFARGAFLAALALFAVIWLRSPRKGPTLLAGVVGGVVIITAASVLHPENSFWSEIMSVFEEGTQDGTGEDRWELWKAATRVFFEYPLFGVGPRNFGVFASEFFAPGDLGGMYAQNPRVLYDRSLHSFYFQTLSEQGIVGLLALVWILVDFWRRNTALRSAAAERRWHKMGGQFQLSSVALGLEACMVAFLVTAGVYAMTGIHWFYTMLALNLVLHSIVTMPPPRRGTRNRLRRHTWNA